MFISKRLVFILVACAACGFTVGYLHPEMSGLSRWIVSVGLAVTILSIVKAADS